MQKTIQPTAKLSRSVPETSPTHDLAKIAHRWNHGIRHALRQFAQYRWPDARLLGLVPIHSYHLREQIESETLVWWIEHDIPPYDLYRSEAYGVELSLEGADQPRLVVRSGASAYPVDPMSQEGLRIALVRASADRPLVVHRHFGPALDP